MKLFISYMLCFCLGFSTLAQSQADKDKAVEIARDAIKKMDNGQYEEAIKLLEQSQKLDPENYVYPYEIGFAYYLQKDYKKAIKVFKNVIKFETCNDRCYTMLGNSYDLLEQPKKAMAAYQEGLKRFPNSGPLHYEMGIVQEGEKLYDEALTTWENGIAVQPEYASNYHSAALYYCKYTTERVWGVLYGELFMNIDRGSKKTEKISKILYETYLAAITFKSDSQAHVSFTKSMQLSLPVNGEKPVLPFTMPYEMTMAIVSANNIPEKELSIKDLHNIRTSFIKSWFASKNHEKYPNILFDWQKKLIEKGYFEAYDYWLFSSGNPKEFESWYEDETNKAKFDEFIGWFSKNPMPINADHSFHRTQY